MNVMKKLVLLSSVAFIATGCCCWDDCWDICNPCDPCKPSKSCNPCEPCEKKCVDDPQPNTWCDPCNDSNYKY